MFGFLSFRLFSFDGSEELGTLRSQVAFELHYVNGCSGVKCSELLDGVSKSADSSDGRVELDSFWILSSSMVVDSTKLGNDGDCGRKDASQDYSRRSGTTDDSGETQGDGFCNFRTVFDVTRR